MFLDEFLSPLFDLSVFLICLLHNCLLCSVDIPISKTLVALKRVRSLRDPSTNGVSRLSPLVDDGDWEDGSSNGVSLSLRFLNGSHACDSNGNGLLRSSSLDFKGQREQDTAEFELDFSFVCNAFLFH